MTDPDPKFTVSPPESKTATIVKVTWYIGAAILVAALVAVAIYAFKS